MPLPENFWMGSLKGNMYFTLLKGAFFFFFQNVVYTYRTGIFARNYYIIFKIQSTPSLWDRPYGTHHFGAATCFLSKIDCPSVAPLAGVFFFPLALLSAHTFGGRLCSLVSLKTPWVWRESIRKEIIYWSHGTGCLFPLIQRLSKQPIAHLIEYISSWCLQRVLVLGF